MSLFVRNTFYFDDAPCPCHTKKCIALLFFVGSARRSIAKCCKKYAAISNNLYAWLNNIGGYQILRFIFTLKQ